MVVWENPFVLRVPHVDLFSFNFIFITSSCASHVNACLCYLLSCERHTRPLTALKFFIIECIFMVTSCHQCIPLKHFLIFISNANIINCGWDTCKTEIISVQEAAVSELGKQQISDFHLVKGFLRLLHSLYHTVPHLRWCAVDAGTITPRSKAVQIASVYY